ncbi:hypothetical protein [Clostridium saccharobutylicum]|uniref:Uncharacterized protein n=1 Tax=Clostridium saccharobutylicum DSM 13864 TaxID=1345695 RepID=U5MQU7_CLOSA|nr:hypothetical protein [Clostridium saccharobutylicum]AGX41812.1 hypothetical protein CLSA_c07990 [Clostridium saccharobutylicum DSM 13864]AQR89088.1 hypothetical protein CLOSC_07840 [Clostridium saccharobutylicum]AQR98989.1 hypothetical protein CSACC_07910 [Clostridium saccharobutylicum]AQS08702.1 hypothetical protein CLOBY_08120 [Clostridium saccharobutylicum]AQS12977.1 hypothetical protein CLOSACC_07910 [Clostridium saccharobutylicum]
MIIESKLLKIIEDEIIKACRDEVKEGNSQELLGLEIQYFYDGEFADIGFKIIMFDNDEDEGYSIYKSLILDYQEIKESLLYIIGREEKANKYDTIRTIAKEIKEHIEKIEWNEIVQTSEEFYFDLVNYD